MAVGLKAVVDEAGPGDDQRVQPELFEIEAVSPTVGAAGQTAGRPGRPKGSRNRTTREWQDYLLGKYGSPLEGAMDLARKLGDLKEVERLASRLDCAPLEALKACLAASVAAAPYVHQKLPIAIDATGVQPIPLILRMGRDGDGRVQMRDIQVLEKNSEEYQRLIAGQSYQSDDMQSDDDANLLIAQDDG